MIHRIRQGLQGYYATKVNLAFLDSDGDQFNRAHYDVILNEVTCTPSTPAPPALALTPPAVWASVRCGKP